MHNKILKLLMVLFFLWSGALAAEDIKTSKLSRADYDRVLANPGDETVFQDFLRKFPQHVFKDGEVTRTFYIVEGDLLLTEQQMREVAGCRAITLSTVRLRSAS